MVGSAWYSRRLQAQAAIDLARYRRQVTDLQKFLNLKSHRDVSVRLDLSGRLVRAEARLEAVQRPDYLERLRGTLGVHPSLAETGRMG